MFIQKKSGGFAEEDNRGYLSQIYKLNYKYNSELVKVLLRNDCPFLFG